MSPDNIAFKVPAAHIVAEDTDLGIERTRNCFAADVIRGLSARYKHLLPKYFYDATGSRLFEEIRAHP